VSTECHPVTLISTGNHSFYWAIILSLKRCLIPACAENDRYTQKPQSTISFPLISGVHTSFLGQSIKAAGLGVNNQEKLSRLILVLSLKKKMFRKNLPAEYIVCRPGNRLHQLNFNSYRVDCSTGKGVPT
jgi:hypothetical protein